MINFFSTSEKLRRSYQFFGDMEIEFSNKRKGLDFKRFVESTGFSVKDSLGICPEFYPINSRLWLSFGSDNEIDIDEAGEFVSETIDLYPGDGPFRTYMYERFMVSKGRDKFFEFIEEEAKRGRLMRVLMDNTQMKFRI
ncbi:hypothetical protein HNV12_03710 [Methanococcoides sp. SA1]|nr:hypothetical protein [Methanococcoides sp. SA1]